MKLEDLFLFLEQEDDDDQDIDPMPNWQPDDEEGEDAVHPDEPEEPAEPRQPRPAKQLSPTQQAKKRWKEEAPHVPDFQIEEAIGFFRARKDNLRPYHPYGYIDPATGRHYINLPEITTIVMRYPEMENVLSNESMMKDIRNYPWEVMNFYQETIQAQIEVIDEENMVPGFKLSFEEQLRIAKEKWDNPNNLIINEGGIKVRKIESKYESIEYGSIQRILNVERRDRGETRGAIYWCTTVPVNDKSRSNLWTTYRPQNAFYFVWDTNRNESDKYYFGAIMVQSRGGYSFVDLYNSTSNTSWAELTQAYPVLEGKQNQLPYFGLTEKETKDALTVDRVTMTPGHKYYFGTIPEAYQEAYVDSGRHVNDVKAFLTMRPKTRKLYVDKTTLEHNDIRHRFVCNDPNEPFGILEVLRLQTKPEDLYKYLDRKILRTNLAIPDGILAIKKWIIGTNWRRWLSDKDTGLTLVSSRSKGFNLRNVPKYGLMDLEKAEFVKDIHYIASTPKTYMHVYEEEGIKRRKLYIFQRYTYSIGDGRQDENEYFYFLCLKEALTDKNSEYYLKGKYFDGPEGDEYIKRQVDSKILIKI